MDKKVDNSDKYGKLNIHPDITISDLYCMIDEAPMSISLWNEKNKGLYCNQYTVNLFKYEDKIDCIENFFKLSPRVQPDGRPTRDATTEIINETIKKGFAKFNWLYVAADGEEIPTEMILELLEGRFDSEGNRLMIAYARDIRTQLADYEDDELESGFFYNRISDKTLFNTIAELSAEWFWAYDVSDSTIQFFGEGRKILQLPVGKNKFPEGVVGSGIVYPDDLEQFLEFARAMDEGVTSPCDVRFILPDGAIRHYRIVYKMSFDSKGKPIFAIGKTYDIHDQVTLETMSRTDLLTNCLNKITTENSIKEAISNNKQQNHCLFIIDIDDFKSVNDQLGHYFGDLVLSGIADNLHNNFRGNDIIGRIGGDEFVVFVKNLSNNKIITRKAEAIAEAFRNSFSGENSDYKISGSIGVSQYPKDGKTYEELYKSADKALYSSKMRGKDCYTFYSEDLADGVMKDLTTVDSANKLSSAYFDSEFVSTVFDLMYDSSDVSSSINTVLQLIGKRFNVEHSYFMETFDEGKTYGVTYEWSSTASGRVMDKLQGVPTEKLGKFFDEIDTNGIITTESLGQINEEFVQNLVKALNIKTLLMMLEKGSSFTRLVLALSDSTKSRTWTEQEINSIRYALKMISIFVASHRRKTCTNLTLCKDIGLDADEIALLDKLQGKGYTFLKD